ncbi:unnamed protein product [Sphagnum troendelagicum]|uniref:UMP kinase n=1 Tax=Sphagnum troendelagicum TaxID=128251 RepID=A0ABP0THW5_9BRYO
MMATTSPYCNAAATIPHQLSLTSFSSLSSFSRTCLQPTKQLLSNYVKSKRDLRACNPMAEQKSLRLWGACLRTEEPNVTASQRHDKKILSIHVSSLHNNARRRAMLRALPDINGGSGLRSPGTSSLVSEMPLLPSSSLRWRRVLLKVSGEALLGDGSQNIDPKITMSIAREVAIITRLGVEVAIVVGGGNFFRGSKWVGSSGLDRASADHIGMMATVMNAIFLQASMESIGVPTRVQTAFRMAEVAEPYIRRRAIRHLEKGRVVIFGAGTGNPFFTTDTAAALRAAEINAEVVLKATNVDGVYDSDPRKNANATLLNHVSYRDVALKNLSVMDITAITLCQENHIPVVVFNLNKPGNISRALSGEQIGTLIDDTGLNLTTS